MNADDRTRLLHMLDAARDAISFTVGRKRDDLDEDRQLLLSLVKEIEIVGEAASKVSLEGREYVPEIPWRRLTGMRNRLTYGYFDWELETTWSTVMIDLPNLVRQLAQALASGT